MAGLLFASLPALPGLAQENPPQAEQGPAPKSAPQAKAQGGDSIGARLGRLEEKIKDLQVMVGTLESFVRAKPGAVLPQEAPAPAPQGQSAPGDLGPRIDALETQIPALTSHIEQIGRQMSALEAKLSAAPALPAPLPPSAEPLPDRQGQAPAAPSDTALASAPDDRGDDDDTSKPRWYGPKSGTDEVAALLEGQAGTEPPENGATDGEPQSLMAALPGGDAQALYQQGHGALLQKDYAGAEGAFRQLLDTYPNDPVAGDAQYWIGETYYVRGEYKNAADAFLKGYKKYKSGQKAPDTLLKLGMALAALGQKDAACSTFNELKAKYPAAPVHVADEAKGERKKAGC
ncbi:MAG: tol-pal system protein YbgF [Methyloceanibacter sp.]|nr:tol-pal system protein YbgF [Methyloceanibacter sp.]